LGNPPRQTTALSRLSLIITFVGSAQGLFQRERTVDDMPNLHLGLVRGLGLTRRSICG
jgi:hypothetical protein